MQWPTGGHHCLCDEIAVSRLLGNPWGKEIIMGLMSDALREKCLTDPVYERMVLREQSKCSLMVISAEQLW